MAVQLQALLVVILGSFSVMFLACLYVVVYPPPVMEMGAPSFRLGARVHAEHPIPVPTAPDAPG